MAYIQSLDEMEIVSDLLYYDIHPSEMDYRKGKKVGQGLLLIGC